MRKAPVRISAVTPGHPMSVANYAYLRANGWPVLSTGALKPLRELDPGELRAIAGLYARTLIDESNKITTRERELSRHVGELQTDHG